MFQEAERGDRAAFADVEEWVLRLGFGLGLGFGGVGVGVGVGVLVR